MRTAVHSNKITAKDLHPINTTSVEKKYNCKLIGFIDTPGKTKIGIHLPLIVFSTLPEPLRLHLSSVLPVCFLALWLHCYRVYVIH